DLFFRDSTCEQNAGPGGARRTHANPSLASTKVRILKPLKADVVDVERKRLVVVSNRYRELRDMLGHDASDIQTQDARRKRKCSLEPHDRSEEQRPKSLPKQEACCPAEEVEDWAIPRQPRWQPRRRR